MMKFGRIIEAKLWSIIGMLNDTMQSYKQDSEADIWWKVKSLGEIFKQTLVIYKQIFIGLKHSMSPSVVLFTISKYGGYNARKGG